MIKFNKLITSLLLTGLILGLFTAPAHAHRMIILIQEPGVLKVIYDDNSAAKLSEVTLYDINDNQLTSGSVDENGYFHYDVSLNPKKAIANDGLGHQVVLDMETGEIEDHLSKWAGALIGVSFLTFFAAFFHYRNTRAK